MGGETYSMNINASIIDQQVSGLMEAHPEWFPGGDENRKRSTAFVLLCMMHHMDIPGHEALDLLTDGGNDAGVDGLHLGEVEDGEFLVTLFQGKYKRDLEGTANFPENAVKMAVQIVPVLFDPSRELTLNEKLAPRIEEIRSLIRDGYVPQIRFVLCNNGIRWNDVAQEWIDHLLAAYPEKVEFLHFNHDAIIKILQRTKTVDARLQLSGQVIVEDMNFMRVLLGRVSVHQIASLFDQHGDQLLQRNIRRYLGLHSNRVNTAIHDTLCSDKADRFYFYNNGITVVCDKFEYNALQRADHMIQVKNMQIINGGQTCKTIHDTLTAAGSGVIPETAHVMIRIYQLAEDNKDFVQDITYATNSQNPVDLRDLRSNDELQKKLELGMQALGYTYKRQREEGTAGPNVIPSSVAAESILAVWREKPHQAKFRRREHFGKLYHDIFDRVNAAQAILAVLIFRDVENRRKRKPDGTPPPFVPYASHYLSMLVGRELLRAGGLALQGITHQNFKEMTEMFHARADSYYAKSITSIQDAIRICYGDRHVSLQQLAATFRRGDLLQILT